MKMTHRTMKRIVLCGLVCLVILSGVQMTFSLLGKPPKVAHAAGAFVNDDILLIHGFNKDSKIYCPFVFPKSAFQNEINARGGSGTVKTIAYYEIPDGNHTTTACDFDITSYDGRCSFYSAPAYGDEGTNQESFRHVACNLAWYIWDTYTQYGRNVNVVAHSAGGVVIQWALYGVYNQLTDSSGVVAFPPALIVHNVVTGSSPHGGRTGADVV